MAKLSAHGTELVRYFSPRKRALVSVRSDGVTLIRYPSTNWKLYSRKKPKVTLAEWGRTKRRVFEAQPQWARECKSLPTMEDIKLWNLDSVCETVDGETCEPDYQGSGSHGPSWLVALGYL